MRSRINLATNPFINYRRFALMAGMLAVVAVGLTVLLGLEGVRSWQDRTGRQAHRRELQGQRARLAAEQQRLESELRAAATQELLERTRFLNQLIQQKRFSWSALFFDLQEQLPPRMRILALSPSLRPDGHLQVELHVGGQSALAVIEFLRALEQAEKFRSLALHSQRRAAGSEPDAVTARVSAIYVQE